MKQKPLPSMLKYNLWKFFLYNLSERRHFIPILSIYFLTLPNTTAQQIGIFTAIGSITSFLFEIPSGYFADRFGHINTLVLGKIFMILSLISFITASSLGLFILGSIFMALGFACHSGTYAAFMHNMLLAFKREKEFIRIMSKLSANVSLFSAFLIILLPFLTTFSIVLPLKINLVFDGIGLIVLLTIRSYDKKFKVAQNHLSSIWGEIKNSTRHGFYPAALFVGAIGGFILGSHAYRYVYLESLGYPIIFIGFVMGISRFVWFAIGNYAHTLERKVGIQSILRFDLIVFPLLFIAVAYFSNPYLVGAIFSIVIGYYWGRNHIITNHFLTSFVQKEQYKATILSIKDQIEELFAIVVAFAIGFVMTKSYRLGHLVLGLVLLALLLFIYPAMMKATRK